jgi:hypothetical protein
MWTREQMIRLACEEKLLQQQLPRFSFYDYSGSTYIMGWESPPNTWDQYCLRLPIAANFPFEEPELLVTHPSPLYTLSGTEVVQSGSHDFHTRGCNEQGHLKICHCPPGTWDASKTCFSVLFKGILWVHAYERHLRTGQTIEEGYQEYERRLRQ